MYSFLSRPLGSAFVVLLVGAAFLFPVRATLAENQRMFETPEAAVEAVLEAFKNNDSDALLDIVGHEHRDLIEVTDEIAQREERKELYQAAQEMWTLREDSETERTWVIGNKAWPMPIPIVKVDGGWRLDTAVGKEEILNRRIGEHELDVINICEAYSFAQLVYASEDRDSDEVLEYAQRFRSTEGKRDGLYWKGSKDEDLSPAGPLIAEYDEYLEGREPGDPLMGYYYRIITRQGSQAPGGQHDYVINGNMIAGFAMVAFPADYGSSGIMTFVVSHHGKVFEKDLGENTTLIAGAISDYNPDESWSEVDE